MKQRIFTLLLVLLGVLQSYASGFNDGTLKYTILTDASGTATTNLQVDGPVDASPTAITIPATVKNGETTYNVTSIGEKAFYNCTSLASVDLSKATALTTIGISAFSGCSALASVDLSNATALTTISNYAFQGCSNANFTSITIPKSVTTIIGTDVFKTCTHLTDVTILAPSIGTWFKDNTTIQKLTLGSGVTSIANQAF